MSIQYTIYEGLDVQSEVRDRRQEIAAVRKQASEYSHKSADIDRHYRDLSNNVSQYTYSRNAMANPIYGYDTNSIYFSQSIPTIIEKRNMDVDAMASQQNIVYTTGLIAMATLLVAALYAGKTE